MKIIVVGAHLTGLPLNHQLTERGGSKVADAVTAPQYKLYALPNTNPLKPGLIRTHERQENGITVEIWSLPTEGFATFVDAVPPPLCIGNIELSDGSVIKGFLCEAYATVGAADITHTGGWRAYVASLP
ncbi:MAG TPA: hypothetical protein VGB55_08825 [Tepidisphaeraceae bacterium]